MALELAPKNQLVPLSAETLSLRHPLRILHDIYVQQAKLADGAQLPDLETIISLCPAEIIDYWLLLEPISADPYIDFMVLQKGAKIPGLTTNAVNPGERFTDGIEATLATERLMELTSCIVLKTPRYSEAMSARRAAVNIKVYRGAYPVWQVERKKSGIILMIAQPYAQI